MHIALGPLIAAVIGLVAFLIGRGNGDIREIGRCLMWCGTLTVLLLSGHGHGSSLALGPLIVAVVGLVIYLIARTNGEAREVGKCFLWCGTLAALLLSGHGMVQI